MPRNGRRRDPRPDEQRNDGLKFQPPRRWSSPQHLMRAPLKKGAPRVGRDGVTHPESRCTSSHQAPAEPWSRPKNQHRRERYFQSEKAHHHHYPPSKRERAVSKDPQNLLLKSREFRKFLLRVMNEGRAKMDEWLSEEHHHPSEGEGSWGSRMDWKPEQTTEIRYVWVTAPPAAEREECREGIKGGGEVTVEQRR